MKTLATFLFLVFSTSFISAQDLEFVHSYGPTEDGGSHDRVNISKHQEEFSKVVIGGSYYDEMNLEIGSMAPTMTANNEDQLQGFVAIYSIENDLLYQYNIGAVVSSAMIVNDSTFLVVGRYSGTYDFDPRPTDSLMNESTLPNSTDAFAGLYHLNGTPHWVSFFNSLNYVQISDPLVFDESIIIGGNFSSEVFTINLSNEMIEVQNPEEDLNAYMISLDLSGGLDWHRILDMENSNCAIRSMDKVSEDLILTLQMSAGDLNASLSAEPTFIPFSGDFNSFVGSYASQTNLSNFSTLKTSEDSPFIWPRHTGSVDNFGRVTANNGRGTNITFTSSIEEEYVEVSAPDELDFFYFNAIGVNGYIKWENYFPYSDIMNVLDIELDTYGYSYIVGYYQDQIFHEENLLFEENDSPLDNGFIMKLDPLGNLVWAHNIPSQQGELEVNSVSINEEQDILISGYYTGNHDFDFSNNTEYVGNFEEENGFLALYTQEPNEAAVFLNVPILHTEIEEGGATSKVYISINREISEYVIMQVTPDEQLDLGNGPGEIVGVVFAPGGEKIKSLDVIASDDLAVEGDHTGSVSFITLSGDSNFGSLDDQILTFDIIDNDPDAVGEQVSKQSKLSIYPNPASNQIHLDYDGSQNEILEKVEVLNAKGQVVLQLKDHSTEKPINTSSLADGVYLLRVTDGDAQSQVRFVVNRR